MAKNDYGIFVHLQIFLMVLRCFGIENRLLISLQPIPLKEKTKGPPRRKSNDGSQSKNTNETNSSNDKSKSGSGSDQASTSQDSASKVVASSKTTPKAKNATQRKCASKTAAIKAPRDNDDYEAVSEEISSSGDEWEEDKKKRKKRTPKKKKEDQTEDDAIEVRLVIKQNILHPQNSDKENVVIDKRIQMRLVCHDFITWCSKMRVIYLVSMIFRITIYKHAPALKRVHGVLF